MENRITIDPEKRGGKPCIRGLSMTVYDVLEYLASGMSKEDILKDFPDLTRETSALVLLLRLIENENLCDSSVVKPLFESLGQEGDRNCFIKTQRNSSPIGPGVLTA